MKNPDLRILFLRSNPIAPDPRVEKEACALAGAGYLVRSLGWDRTAALPLQESRAGWEIVRLPIRADFGHGMGNLPQLLRWQWGLWRWLACHRQEYDLIHACDFDTILPSLLAKFLWGKPVIYDIFDFYAEHLRRTPGWIKSLIRRMDLWAINHADALILADDSRREQISGTHPRRLTVIYNSPEDVLGTFKGEDLRPPGSQLHLAYIGLLQVERGLLQMLEVLRLHPKWTLALAGFGGDLEHILSLAQALPNVAWHGRIPYERALQLSASADALFATYDPAIPNHRYSSPNKIFEAMMLGKPCVVARGTNMDRIIRQADCGLVVRYGDVEELEAVLSRLAEEPALRQRLGENGRRAYEATYDWHHMRQRLLALYADLIRMNLR
jgi:glycosyltransferase involved in cell wall biosynthesis